MSKITESAKGEECDMRIPGICNYDRETTVWAHANGLAAGKGIGRKSHDPLGCYACFACHNVYDRRVPRPDWLTRPEIELYFAYGHQRSFCKLVEKELVKW